MRKNITRRRLLVGSAAFGASTFASRRSRAANLQEKCELFAFRSQGTGSHVLAVVVSAAGIDAARQSSPGFDVDIHAGERTWAVRPLQKIGKTLEDREYNMYAGEVHGPLSPSIKPSSWKPEPNFGARVGVSASGPTFFLSKGNASKSAIRSSMILARFPDIATHYRAALSNQEKAELVDLLIERAAATENASTRRVALLLVQDALSYHPDLPMGFTFAGRNGRHPSDDAASVIATVLAGAVTPRGDAPPFMLGSTFPYFRPIGIAA